VTPMSRHRNGWGGRRRHRSDAERELERWTWDAITSRPPIPAHIPRDRPMKIEEIIAAAKRIDPVFAAARAEWEARWVDGMPAHLRDLKARKWEEGRPAAEAQEREARNSKTTLRPLAHRDPSTTAHNGRPSIAHLTPEQRRARKLEQTRASNARKREEHKRDKLRDSFTGHPPINPQSAGGQDAPQCPSSAGQSQGLL
jgi:hypothetical protein